MKINIIGAGPAGNYTAYLLARKGHKVNVYEKNPKIGPPIQCTGILSDYFSTLLDIDEEYLLNTVSKTRIHAPNGNYVEAKIKKNYVICRKKFDNYLANLARKEGVKYYLNHSFKSISRKGTNITSKFNYKNKEIKSMSDILIGADGPLSTVSKSAGLFKDRQFIFGTQIEAEMKNDNVVEFYPHIGCYAWIVPVNKKIVRIGVASYKNTLQLFKRFATEKLGEKIKNKTIENQSGVIPVFNPLVKTQRNNIYIIGDAATFVKATSGGGINQSLKAARILAYCINKKKNYQKEWRKQLFNNLFVHLLAHKMHARFSNDDWNYVIKEFSKKKNKNFLFSKNRDNIISMMLSLSINNPNLVLKFFKYFPFNEILNYKL